MYLCEHLIQLGPRLFSLGKNSRLSTGLSISLTGIKEITFDTLLY